MAIIKKLNSRVGIEVGYHRVIGVNLNYRDRENNSTNVNMILGIINLTLENM